ncbi:MAG: hypothetical protein JOY71_16500 [Acetobacteraceae bacterium]|nr:hypothetical protein [Acetobacteraceae bacterium]
MPLLALSGGLDDWTPAARCMALANMPANLLMTIQVYPRRAGARPLQAGDAAATTDAHVRVQAFLQRYLH